MNGASTFTESRLGFLIAESFFLFVILLFIRSHCWPKMANDERESHSAQKTFKMMEKAFGGQVERVVH